MNTWMRRLLDTAALLLMGLGRVSLMAGGARGSVSS